MSAGCECGTTTGNKLNRVEGSLVKPLRANLHRGICFAHNYEEHGRYGYGTSASERSLRSLRKLGADWLSVTPFAFMRDAHDPVVTLPSGHPGAETDAVMRRAFAQFRRLGWNVLLKPHVWIRGGVFRGQMEMRSEEGWTKWFESYGDFVRHYAAMAQREGAAIFAVGVEFDQSVRRSPQRWRDLIAEVRTIYRGKLVYSANWDQIQHIPIWDALDFIGVQFYPPLADSPGTPEAVRRLRLRKHLHRLRAVSRRFDRPVLLTEVGYRSIREPDVAPHAWPEKTGPKVPDERAQARSYRRLINHISQQSWIAGVYWWKWFTHLQTKEEGTDGFSPHGKAAQRVLKRAFARPTAPRPSPGPN